MVNALTQKRQALIDELVASCPFHPGVGCRRQSAHPWCVQCRAAENILCQLANIDGLRDTLKRLNKRCQMVEAAAGAKAYSDDGKRIAKYLHEQIRELRAEVVDARRQQVTREIADRNYTEEAERRIADRDRARAGYTGVYFVQCGTFIKIGVSVDVRARVRSLDATKGPVSLHPLGFIPCDDPWSAELLERQLHSDLRAHHQRGEWFTDCEPIRLLIADRCQAWPGVAR